MKKSSDFSTILMIYALEIESMFSTKCTFIFDGALVNLNVTKKP